MSEEQVAKDKQSNASKPTTTTTTPDNKNSSTTNSSPTSASNRKSASRATAPAQNKEELIIAQVRTELETYFAPQNIQNDFNLRQKMTTDGYIDIDLLLDLKLISDLASNREILIEAISRSKCLVMNTGCTMVKYMPLLERNVLILRDIPTSTDKKVVLAIFDNEHCDKPQEVHSDIGNNWFCQFKTEDECLSTAKYLQQSGSFNGERLHVRVKAIHDKNKADTSPTMQQPQSIGKKSKPLSPQQYSAVPPPGYYGAAPAPPPYAAAYYGAPIDPYAYAVAQYVTAGPPPPMAVGGKPRTRSNKKRSSKRDEESGGGGGKVNGQPAMELTPPVDGALMAGTYEATAAEALEDERTPTSDYPGKFDKYTQEQFVAIYQAMKGKALLIPQAMRGRDMRIISERLQTPTALNPDEDEHGDADTKEADADAARGRNNGAGGGKVPKRRKKRKQQFKHEVHGTYYEDPVYEYAGYAQAPYDVAPTGAGGGYYDEAYDNGDSYYVDEYAGPPKQAPRDTRGGNRRYRNTRRSDTRGGNGGNNADYGGGYYDTGYYDTGYGGGDGDGGNQSSRRGPVARQYKPKRSPTDYNATNATYNAPSSQPRARARWSQKQAPAKKVAKQYYSTSKGVYRPKQAASN